MINPARGVVRRSVLKALVLALAGCGGEPVVVQSKSDKIDRMKGSAKGAPAPGDPEKK
jgi:hypothetical protein